jgi:hypothetical protein
MMIEKMSPKTVKLFSISIQSLVNSAKSFFLRKVRRVNFENAKDEAIRRCETENRKMYVIQDGAIHWKVFSTAEVRDMKNRRIFKKSLSFKEMDDKAAYTCFPKNK